ncbi:MAG: flavodoxin-dependent (E)-4-hydroxy-3-methylbut-2-enyl-diphosphate synthase [Bacteroidetes bacterium]|nr:flavodoxin-dependent (E)-4-hydroxy-3-methylbut-2-enyl-diphosphate synthase [Bacteroidota bacterium]MCL5026508.1 flavodoxin-dependent (E)-4-hydroxy-3-methylbut-2-enyl-diphosphate synthase [Chloroflexota bacterium]
MRRSSRQIHIGPVAVGGGAPIVVQSMTSTDTRDAAATVAQVRELEEWGCEIVRVAVPDREAADQLRAIKAGINIPLVADIHFDYHLALQALAAGVDGLRLNPGNIRDPEKVKQVVVAAKERGVPIRIGVNAGSLPERQAGDERSTAERMVALALEQVRLLESLDFDLIKLSLKAFDVPTTVEAYRRMAAAVPYPLHLGITEAGTPRTGIIRSSVGLGILLHEGIGDTIRVSLTAPPREEVRVAYEILKSLDLREHGPILISCPTCGRVEIDLMGLAERVDDALQGIRVPLKVAVMGCVVNGPGEAREADVGIAGGKGRGIVFRHGQVVRTVAEDELYEALMDEIRTVVNELER